MNKTVRAKVIDGLLLAMIMVFALVACGGGKTTRKCAVANQRKHMILLPSQIARTCHAKCSGYGGRAVSRIKTVIFTFRCLRKTGQSTFATQCIKSISASGNNLMNVTLMPHIKNKLVLRKIHGQMQCHG